MGPFSWSNWNLECWLLWKRKTGVPGEKSLEQGKDHQQTWHVHHQRTLKPASTTFDAIKIIVSIIQVCNLHGEAKSQSCFTVSCVPDSTFNYLQQFHSDFLYFNVLQITYHSQLYSRRKKKPKLWLTSPLNDCDQSLSSLLPAPNRHHLDLPYQIYFLGALTVICKLVHSTISQHFCQLNYTSLYFEFQTNSRKLFLFDARRERTVRVDVRSSLSRKRSQKGISVSPVSQGIVFGITKTKCIRSISFDFGAKYNRDKSIHFVLLAQWIISFHVIAFCVRILVQQL